MAAVPGHVWMIPADQSDDVPEKDDAFEKDDIAEKDDTAEKTDTADSDAATGIAE